MPLVQPIKFSALLCCCLLFWWRSSAQPLASFPGAEGFGALATGGRGGERYHVTSLADSGNGSFREAVSKAGRTVVFDVCGVIKIGDKIKAAESLTIAGQTAPGAGVVVYGNTVSFSSNTIVRYMRFRGSIGMAKGSCTVVADDLNNIIFDHVSIQWGRWDNLHLKNSSDITMQYCIIGESIEPQRFGALLEGPTNFSMHHCLWIDNQSRNPKAKAGISYVNNIVYNWGASGLVGGHSEADHFQDIINNYFIAGPNSTPNFIAMFSATDHVYQSGNYVDLDKNGSLNGRLVADSDFTKATATLLEKPTHSPLIPVKVEDAAAACRTVLQTAGASIVRDSVDSRLISYLQSMGTKGKIFQTEADAGGQPTIYSDKALPDTDGDGIPDIWEKQHGLQAGNGADGKEFKLSKTYTNLEVYINSIPNRLSSK
ncbi:MAG: hypothetical protein ABIX01_10070 [Chitinophagaceae bacterium]